MSSPHKRPQPCQLLTADNNTVRRLSVLSVDWAKLCPTYLDLVTVVDPLCSCVICLDTLSRAIALLPTIFHVPTWQFLCPPCQTSRKSVEANVCCSSTGSGNVWRVSLEQKNTLECSVVEHWCSAQTMFLLGDALITNFIPGSVSW